MRFFYALVILYGSSAFAQGFFMTDEEVYRYEAALARQRVRDFKHHREVQRELDEERMAGADEVRRARQAQAEQDSDAQRQYAQSTPRYDMIAEAIEDAKMEREMLRENEKYLALQKEHVQKRDYFRELMMREPQVDEMEEYGLRP